MLSALTARAFPGQLVIQHTDRCNANCPQCGMRSSSRFPRSKLTPDQTRRLIDAAAARGIKAVSFTGGEPLLYPDECTSAFRGTPTDDDAEGGVPAAARGRGAGSLTETWPDANLDLAAVNLHWKRWSNAMSGGATRALGGEQMVGPRSSAKSGATVASRRQRATPRIAGSSKTVKVVEPSAKGPGSVTTGPERPARRYLKTRPVCRIAFRLPAQAAAGASSVHVAGEFNGWDFGATPLSRFRNGDFGVTVDLPAGREYRFRYLIDGCRWENDWDADRYDPNPYGGFDSVVVV